MPSFRVWFVRRVGWRLVQSPWVTGDQDLDLLRPLRENAEKLRKWEEELRHRADHRNRDFPCHAESVRDAERNMAKYRALVALYTWRCRDGGVSRWKFTIACR